MQQQETNETSKKETEMGHKGPVKKIYKTQNQVEKRHTQSSGWNNVVKGGKKKKKDTNHSHSPADITSKKCVS